MSHRNAQTYDVETISYMSKHQDDILPLQTIWILSKKWGNTLITEWLIGEFSWKVDKNHHRIHMYVYHSTKNKMNRTYSLGGAWFNPPTPSPLQTHTYTRTHRGVTRLYYRYEEKLTNFEGLFRCYLQIIPYMYLYLNIFIKTDIFL